LREVIPDVANEDDDVQVDNAGMAEELSGKMHSDPEEERLAHTVLDNDEQMVRDGEMLAESVDYSLNSFTPDLMFEKLVSNYRDAERLYGPTIVRELTGMSPKNIEKNSKITEFKQELKNNIQRNFERLQKDGLLDENGKVTEEGISLAAIVTYTKELDNLQAKGLGKHSHREKAVYGEKSDSVPFVNQRYKNLDIVQTVKRSLRRGHKKIQRDDLRARERKDQSKINIIYALDASGSMRGKKISMSKKAGIALAFKAIEDKNAVGLVVFTNEVLNAIPPTQDFGYLLHQLTRARAGNETDIELAIDEAIQLFGRGNETKHLVLISDAVPTRGKIPEKQTLEAVGRARDAGITLSIVGIALEEEGEELAKKMVEVGEGKLYRVKNAEELDVLVLEEYERVAG
jgi:Mg-chelatase subunit ChlD